MHALSINPSTPHLDYEPFSGIRNFPQQTSLKPSQSFGPLRMIIGIYMYRHELMLQVAVPASFPHSSCKVPFAWHV